MKTEEWSQLFNPVFDKCMNLFKILSAYNFENNINSILISFLIDQP